MDHKRIISWLTLSFAHGLSNRAILNLLNRVDNEEDLIKNAHTLPLPLEIQRQLTHPNNDNITQTLQWLDAAEDHHLVYWGSVYYPPLLASIPDPPILLHVQGEVSSLQQPQLAIVGSRKASPYGLKHAHQFAFDLSRLGLCITSGLALGIDAAAHRGALDAEQFTIAVLGSGLQRLYPRRHTELAEKITQNGAIVSEFPLTAPPLANHFPRRNRIISGLCAGTLVIEATQKSGSLITARLANEQGREVFAIPGAVSHPQSRGPHQLIQEGAKCVTHINDILEEIDHFLPLPANTGQQIIDQKLDSTLHHLLECVDFTVTTMQDIHKISQLSLKEVTQRLLLLELLGYITKIPGGYIRVA